MDCCGQSKPKETDEGTKAEQKGGNNPSMSEKAHSGGCCGSSGSGMWLHLILMIIVVLIISYITKS